VLLRRLPSIAHSIITADAMHCQQESARVITQEKGWDYVFGLKGNQSGILERAKRLLEWESFPDDSEVELEYGHHRMERRRIVRLPVTPEEIGLIGCWQIIAVRRERIPMNKKKEPSDEISYYVSSLFYSESTDDQLHEIIRGHWSAIENGIHYRRDVSFGEDKCRISNKKAAHAMASLRNLAIGTYEILSAQCKIKTDSCKSWSRQLTFGKALEALRC
jgi:predicted transposase YbfD/YdcC